MSILLDALASISEEQQIKTFIQTTCISGSSTCERNFAMYLDPILKDLGFQVDYDTAHHSFGGNCGNMIAYWPGTDPNAEPLLFSAHMDTVLDTASCRPVIRDGQIWADGSSILGADDRSAISSYIEAVRVIQRCHLPCGPIEFLLTVNEQGGLCGSQALDQSKIHSHFGYLFDSDGDVGQVITKSPYRAAFDITFYSKYGVSAGHIGLDADRISNSALKMSTEAYQMIPSGLLDHGETVVQIGMIKGGELSSIIPGKVWMRGEARSYNSSLLEQRLNQIRSACEQIAASYDGTVKLDINGCYDGYLITEQAKSLQCFIKASKAIGIKWNSDAILGGTDNNFLRSYGIDCLTLGQGYHNIHSFNEHISIENLINTTKLVVSLIHHWYQQYTNQ